MIPREYHIHISIPPVPWSRPRATNWGNGGQRLSKPLFFNDKKLVAYEKEIARHAKTVARHGPIDGPIRMRFEFLIQKPASVNRLYPAIKPDTSNLIKAVEDALNGVWYLDDSQIVDLVALKRYSSKPGVDIRMQVIPTATQLALFDNGELTDG